MNAILYALLNVSYYLHNPSDCCTLAIPMRKAYPAITTGYLLGAGGGAPNRSDLAPLPSTPFCASSNRRTTTSQLVLLQICLDSRLTLSEKSVSPAAFSTVSTGTEKLSSGVSSGIGALGRTKAPSESSTIDGVAGETGRAARTTLAKWVGTATFGGEPMSSYDCEGNQVMKARGKLVDVRRAICRRLGLFAGGIMGW